ncbi:MFS transporter [Gemmatimonadetes bacterium T265]|nr:MFS transporter [Gemmatimonadetes bacterium T265]
MSGPDAQDGPRRPPVLLLAVAAGVVVANLYYNQPLLARMARDFGVPVRAIAPVATLTQVGYALGLFAVVPLADVAERRRLLVLLIVGAAAALAAAAVAPTAGALAAASLAVGVLSVAPQVIVPIAADLAPAAERGRAVGTVMSGLLVGILMARVASGALGARLGWRAVFWTAAAGMVVLAGVLRVRLPASRTREALSYRALLASLPAVARRYPALRESAVFGALAFASFSVFWTALPFHLAVLPGHLGSAAAGAFGLVGVAGALAASFVGRRNDRGDPRQSIGAGLAATVAAWLALGLLGRSLAGLVVGVLLLDLGVQAAHISNQARIFALDDASRGRINAVYMVAYFAGGALGSAASATAWARGGWAAVSGVGAAFAALALGVWVVRRPAVVPAGAPAR